MTDPFFIDDATRQEIQKASQSLDLLWMRAEKMGNITVEKALFREEYEVSIRHHRPTGSVIIAKGKSADIRIALGDAVKEAIELGCG